jgi:mxaD protein
MKKMLAWWCALLAVLLVPAVASAQNTLNVYQTVDIGASPGEVWNAVKNYDNLHSWHPAFESTQITSGQNNTPGAMRTLTLKGGGSFEEELLAFDEPTRKLRYRIVGDSPLPIDNYDSTIEVISVAPGESTVIWRSSFTAKGVKDDEAIAVIVGAYRAGLDNLKQMVEGN